MPEDIRRFLERRGLIDLPLAREMMIQAISQKGYSAGVLDAMRVIPRHGFLAPVFWKLGYAALDLWTPEGWLLAPETVASVLHALNVQPQDRVLIVGTEPGYLAALLATLGGQVDILAYANPNAEARLRDMGFRAVRFLSSADAAAASGQGRYDVVVATTPVLYVDSALSSRLKPESGRMVVPVGGAYLPARVLFCKMTNGAPTLIDLGAWLATGPWSATTFPIAPVVPMAGANVPVEGRAVPVEGAEVPVEGLAIPVEGADIPVEGLAIPVEGADIPIEGLAIPVEGADIPIEASPSVDASTAGLA